MGQGHRASRQKSKQEKRTEAILMICPVPKPLPVGGPFLARSSRARSSWIHFMMVKCVHRKCVHSQAAVATRPGVEPRWGGVRSVAKHLSGPFSNGRVTPIPGDPPPGLQT